MKCYYRHFRDVDIIHLQAFGENRSSPSIDLEGGQDCLRSRARTLSGGLAGLQDPDNMAV